MGCTVMTMEATPNRVSTLTTMAATFSKMAASSVPSLANSTKSLIFGCSASP